MVVHLQSQFRFAPTALPLAPTQVSSRQMHKGEKIRSTNKDGVESDDASAAALLLKGKTIWEMSSRRVATSSVLSD